MTTTPLLGARARTLHEAIQDLGAHERGHVTLPVTTITDWKKAATWAASRIAALEAENARLRDALRGAANYIDTLGGVSQSYRIALNWRTNHDHTI